MNFNFEAILFYATLTTGIIALFDELFFARRRKVKQKKLPVIIDYARAFFPVLLLVFLLRSFLFEPFRIPSGSLEPTLMKGDFILVNKYDYGVRLPIVHKKLFQLGEPKRGDIIVFRYPPNPSVDFIKRVIGIPGDKVSYVNKTLYVNGKVVAQNVLGPEQVLDDEDRLWQAQKLTEDLAGVKHNIYVDPARKGQDFKDIVVPEKMYFVMGDNRDNSLDSRFWGFVPEQNIVGKGVLIWMSWAGLSDGVIRWQRIGERI